MERRSRHSGPRAGTLLSIALAACGSAAAQTVPLPPAPSEGLPAAAPSRNPLIVAGDEAYARRQEGRTGGRASERVILEAISQYQTVAEAPDSAEARWKLARALYFRGAYTGLSADSRRAVFEQARRVTEESIQILVRRSARKRASEGVWKGPALDVEALRGDPDAAPVLFWSTVAWGEWALSAGKFRAARSGAADRVRDYATTLVALDPEFEEGGGYRVLGRLHDLAPRIPLLTGWISQDESVRNLRLALRVDSRNLVNRHFLAEALSRRGRAERVEAIALERGILADAPSPGHLVEELAIQEEARHNLETWRK